MRVHHATEKELWVRMFKKGSGLPSVDWPQCVVVALTWGGIDGQRKSLDDVSFIQRFTPRRPKSSWSKKNCEIAERLIADGSMQPSGLLHVEAARQDGRWDRAYVGSAEMVIPADFLQALAKNKKAKAFYATLNRQTLFAIYLRLHSAKTSTTRDKRIQTIIDKLARKEGL